MTRDVLFTDKRGRVHRSRTSLCPDGFWFGWELLQWLLRHQFNIMVCVTVGRGGH